MKAIGIDIGTTSICGVLIDASSGELVSSATLENKFTIKSSRPYERLQDPQAIAKAAGEIVTQLSANQTDIASIGVTGQMHGILYVDEKGMAVSPLYTWQDETGAQHGRDGARHVDTLSRISGCPLACGYGSVTFYSHTMQKKIPDAARRFCTIGDYIAMRLTGSEQPLMHSTNAESLGCYNWKEHAVDSQAVQKAGMDPSFYPRAEKGFAIVGQTSGGIPVSCAIGDNQSSFFGSVRDAGHSVLVNIGTGSQISALSAGLSPQRENGIGLRPYMGEQSILVGAPLCGGRAYALLEQFFESVLRMAGHEPPKDLYGLMEKAGFLALDSANPLSVATTFCGTRAAPQIRGSIQNIDLFNLQPGPFVAGFLNGMAGELFGLYLRMKENTACEPAVLVGSGNGMRKNRLLQEICSGLFGLPVKIPLYNEEAACGCALYSLVAAGIFSDAWQAQRFIRYSQ